MKKSIITITLLLSTNVFASTQWLVNEAKDDFTDKAIITALSQTEQNKPVTLFCYEGEVNIGVTSTAYAGSSKIYTGKYRVDKNEPKTVLFKATKYFHYPVMGNYDELKKGKYIVYQLKNSNDVTTNVKFGLVGFTKAYNKVKATCK